MSILNAEEICALIPHAGAMCLLDSVESFDDKSIVCMTRSHQALHNPLRNHDKLDAVNLIEYAAQTMAVHGGLLARQSGAAITPGYLAAARNVKLMTATIDTIRHSLVISASKLLADKGNFMYAFEVNVADGGEQKLIASGRLTVVVVK